MCNCRFSRDSGVTLCLLQTYSQAVWWRVPSLHFLNIQEAHLLRAPFKIKIHHSWLFKITCCAATLHYLSAVKGTNKLINAVKVFCFFTLFLSFPTVWALIIFRSVKKIWHSVHFQKQSLSWLIALICCRKSSKTSELAPVSFTKKEQQWKTQVLYVFFVLLLTRALD